ncbi:hypothetical protein BJ741DRAFT_663340 [Chytriomyces cf. hyalinus JEL632]|nr:hypothetical protein BJ741DRAFT_663340 [Chytriomyces cf. hyalinus JEL632]
MAEETDCGIILGLLKMKEILGDRPCCSLRDETAQNRLVINCNATKITLLNLANNVNLTGSFPDFSDDMEEIELQGLNFYQPLPLVYPKNLRQLVLTGTNVIGTIPTQLGSLTQLTRLELARNYLTGGIPSEMGQLHGLWNIELQGNQLTGSIPSEFSAFKNLVKCQLQNNSLTGRIPSSYDVDRRANPRMTLIVHHNLLDGPMPLKLDPWDDFGFNCFNAQFPRNAACSGKANQEGLRGEAIAAISVGCVLVILVVILAGFLIHRRRRQMVVQVPAKSIDAPSTPVNCNQPRIHQHRVSKKRSARDTGFIGAIPTQLGKLVSLSKLDMSRNELSGSIPSELAQMRSLEALQLNGNQLSGSIPSEIATMQHLVKCSLHNNLLTGSIPSSFERRANPDMVFNVENNTLSGPYPSNSNPLDTLSVNCFDGQSPRNSACPQVQEKKGDGFKVPAVAIGCAVFGLVAILVVAVIFQRQRSRRHQVVPPSSPAIRKTKSKPSIDGESIQIQVEQHRVSMESLVKITKHDRNELHPHESTQEVSMLNVLLTDAGPMQNYSHAHKKNPENILALQELEGTDPKTWTVQQTATWCASVISSSSSVHDTVLAKGISGRELIEMNRVAVCSELGLVFGDAVQFMATDPNETDCDRVLRVPFLRDAIPMGAQCCQFKDNTVQNTLVIQCDDAGRITVFQYDGGGREFKLSGDLGIFAQLTELTALHVRNNDFFGSIPAFKTWKNLKRLDISYNLNLTGSFPEFSDNMNEIFMDGLRLNQPLPLSYPKNLSVLSVSNSSLFGTIPTQLGKLTSLGSIDLPNNQLSGSIPSEFAQLRSLTVMHLNGNQLSGSIPSEIATMQSLMKCYLQDNFLTGSIASFEHRVNSDMIFNVGNNTLSGPYPSNSGPLDTLSMNCFDGQSPRNSACPQVQENRGDGFKVPGVAIGCVVFGLVAILVVAMIFKQRRSRPQPVVPSKSPSTPKAKSIPSIDGESIQIQIEQHRASMESTVKIIELDSTEPHPHENKQEVSMLNVLLTDAGPMQNYSHAHKKNPENILALQELEGTDPKTWTVQQTATWCASVISSSSSVHDTVLAKGISGRELIEMSRVVVCSELGLVFGDAVVLQDLLLKAVERNGRIGLPAYDDA